MNETPPSLLELTLYLLSKTGKAARNRVAERLAERDLRLWHMAVLAALVDFGPQVQRELASRLAIDRSDVVKVVDDLAVAGLVDRARDADDRRRVSATPTPAGRSVLAEIQSDTRNVQEDLLAPLTEDERTQLEDMLRRVYAHISHEADGQRPSR
ncbi:MarR family winged helix-turn-helix transcriptional regulator [Streptomyces sp. NPDC056227]|uniref:MarR family winged helix-turn-helix transcriptional regulator n=1 Tax=Streptomyces sp. NPDC056227 TaxID=3345753 RepID=UPI0035D7F14B